MVVHKMESGVVPLRGIFVGGQSLLIRCAEIFKKKGHRIEKIITDDIVDRTWATENNVNWARLSNNLAQEIANIDFDYLFCVNMFFKCPPEVIRAPSKLAINYHDGPLPQFAGLNVPVWAIIENARTFGITWHVMTDELDKGDIVSQISFPIDDNETALTLNAKCYEAAYSSFEKLVDDLVHDKITPQRQDLKNRKYYGRKDRVDAAGILDFTRPAEEIEAVVRALNFGNYQNPLTTAKLLIDGNFITVRDLKITTEASREVPGTVVRKDRESITVATGTLDVILRDFFTLHGEKIEDLDALNGARDAAQISLSTPTGRQKVAVEKTDITLALHEDYWIEKIANIVPLHIPLPTKVNVGSGSFDQDEHAAAIEVYRPSADSSPGIDLSANQVRAAFVSYLSLVCSQSDFTICCEASVASDLSEPERLLYSAYVPINVSVDAQQTLQDFASVFDANIDDAISHGSFSLDLFQRRPAIRSKWRAITEAVRVILVDDVDNFELSVAGDVCPLFAVLIDRLSGKIVWQFDSNSISRENVATLHDGFTTYLSACARGNKSISNYAFISENERKKQLAFGAGRRSDDVGDLIHERISKAAAENATRPAVICGDETVDYGELERRANKVAQYLLDIKIKPGSVVGVLMDRNEYLVETLVGILKAGSAYLPLDTRHPAGRLAAIIADAEPAAVVCDRRNADLLKEANARLLVFEDVYDRIRAFDGAQVSGNIDSSDACYVIYTSGSTGTPKGVIVEHGNLANFCKAIDDELPFEDGGTWLAVTSISFDISALELLWTLSRGITVVVYNEADDGQVITTDSSATVHEAPKISLYYFSSDGDDVQGDAYALLLAGAEFADTNGLDAVWIPERHFHRFGGLYPNPSVLAAALASKTRNVKLRAGSCVLPLHKTIRIAEEWSIVDNLSNGRVGLSCATGWQPSDFVLAPDCYENRHQIMREEIENLRLLWRGGQVTYPGPKGPVDVQIFPRPVQRDIPLWLTAAKNPETFELAGKLGANVLTHLLGQSFEELAKKIEIYRRARHDAGHETAGTVTLMLHTFVNDDTDFVLETVREPMTNYLMSATDLVKRYASTFPTFKMSTDGSLDEKFRGLSKADLKIVCEHAFRRFYEGDGLFGTPSVCVDRINELVRLGVNEIACLIDFGIPNDIVLENLHNIAKVKSQLEADVARSTVNSHRAGTVPVGLADSISKLMRRHGVKYLQCTPSMAAILEKSKSCRQELERLKVMLVGGEALPPSLANRLKPLVGGDLFNMYGPTETTIWSTCHKLTDDDANVPIGKPLLNTDVYVMNKNFDVMPTGFVGEIFIGGKGVTRGYLNLPDLTAERYFENPFKKGERIYKTGDLGYWRNDGSLQIVGRADNQLKILGYRVELDEISRILEKHPRVAQAVVDARDDGDGGKTLAAYLLAANEHTIDVSDLRKFLQYHLPEYMVPSAYVVLSAFPLTTSGKVDRKRLPRISEVRPLTDSHFVAPRTEIERSLAEEWREILDYEDIGVFDNFFDIGGNSLRAVELLLRIEEKFLVDIPFSLLFKHPTIAKIAEEISKLEATEKSDSSRSEIEHLGSEELMQVADEYGWHKADEKKSHL